VNPERIGKKLESDCQTILDQIFYCFCLMLLLFDFFNPFLNKIFAFFVLEEVVEKIPFFFFFFFSKKRFHLLRTKIPFFCYIFSPKLFTILSKNITTTRHKIQLIYQYILSYVENFCFLWFLFKLVKKTTRIEDLTDILTQLTIENQKV